MPVYGLAFAISVAIALSGCNLTGAATGALADALSGSGGAYGKDDDPELIEDALPFALKKPKR